MLIKHPHAYITGTCDAAVAVVNAAVAADVSRSRESSNS